MFFQSISPLDQKWQAIVSLQVYVDINNYGAREWELTNYRKEDYRLSEVIAKIKNLQTEGKLICLFIGRTPCERLPPDFNEAKENEFWFTGDIALIHSEYHEVLKENPTIDNHLWFDFNHQQGLNLINGLFDKIVIDQSTVKAFPNDFPKRFASLLRNSESEMIFESYIQHGYSHQQEDFTYDPLKHNFNVSFSFLEKKIKKINDTYLEYIQTHSIEDIERDKQSLKEKQPDLLEETDEYFEGYFKKHIGDSSSNSYISNLNALFKDHLNSIYNTVEEHVGSYPYTTDWGGEHYFVVRDPKNLTNATSANFHVDDSQCCTIF